MDKHLLKDKPYQRDKSIDIAKGLGILLVVLGHIPTLPTEIKKIIYSFHMPLFFFISGYLYNEAKYNSWTTTNFVKSRIKKFIVPYFIMGFICFALFGVLYPIIANGFSIEYLKQAAKYLIGLFYSWGSPNFMAWSSPLWFLTCIFIAEIILYLVLKNCDKEYVVFIIIGAIGFIYTLITKIRLPWNADVALTAVCFMYIGNICRRYDIINKVYNIKYFLILLIILSVSIIFNSKIDYNLRVYGNILLTYCSGISGSILIILISKLIKENSVLEYFGRNTLYIMGFTYSILNIVLLIGKTFVILNNFIISFILQVVLLSILVYLILKIKHYKTN